MITRNDYIKNPCRLVGASEEERREAHSAYYSQFVTEKRKKMVIARFGVDRLVEAGIASHFDQGFALYQWDFIDTSLSNELKAHGDFWTAAGSTCVFKEAARHVIRDQLNRK